MNDNKRRYDTARTSQALQEDLLPIYTVVKWVACTHV